MQFSLLALSFAGVAFASLDLRAMTTAKPCNADNCARAVTGTRRGPGQLQTAATDCLSFVADAVFTPPPVTITITTVFDVKAKRDMSATMMPMPTIPAYASACIDDAAYSSACSCLGITPSIGTAPTPTSTIYVTFNSTTSVPASSVIGENPTSTIPITSTAPSISSTTPSSATSTPTSSGTRSNLTTSTSSPTSTTGIGSNSTSTTSSPAPGCTADLSSDPLNCGACGTVCSSGVCSEGSCTDTACDAKVCGEFLNCQDNSNCFCFSSTAPGPNNGFCGQNAVCSGLTACANDKDCAGTKSTGNVCAVNTCCPQPSDTQPGVCLQGQCANPASKMMLMARALKSRAGTAAF